MTDFNPFHPKYMSDDEPAYREDDLKNKLTAEQLQEYKSFAADTQLLVAHLVLKGIPYDEAKDFASKTGSGSAHGMEAN